MYRSDLEIRVLVDYARNRVYSKKKSHIEFFVHNEQKIATYCKVPQKRILRN